MTSRFVSNLLILGLGAMMAASRFAFAPTVVHWLSFGTGVAVIVITGAAFLSRGRGSVQRGLDTVIVLVAAWTVVSTLTLPWSTVRWLVLGESGALAGLAALGLVLHERLMEAALRRPHPAAVDGHGPPPAAVPAPLSVAGRSS